MNRKGHGMTFSIVNLVALILLLPFIAVPGLVMVPLHETRVEGPMGVVVMIAWIAVLLRWHVGLWRKHRWAGIMPGIFYLILMGLLCGLSQAGY